MAILQVSIIFAAVISTSLQIAAAQEAIPSLSGGQQQALANTVPEFSSTGGICSWQMQLRDDVTVESLRGCADEFLGISLIVDGIDVSDRFVWRRTEDDDNGLVTFEGVDSKSDTRVIRQYSGNLKSGQLSHSISVDSSEPISGREVKIRIGVSGSLLQHIPDDRSLGDFFYGYARYFARSQNGNLEIYQISAEGESRWVALTTRHTAVVAQLIDKSPDSIFRFNGDEQPNMGLAITVPSGRIHRTTIHSTNLELELFPLSARSASEHQLDELMYSDAWGPFRYLLYGVDILLEWLGSHLGSMGLAVICFAVLVRLLLFPVSLWSQRQQEHYSDAEIAMRPALAEIKNKLKGEEKSERTLELYKRHGITPFTGLKGSVALFVQIPFLVAFFNVTAESVIFRDAGFFWLADLSLPDQILALPITIPVLGSSLNLLPFVLAAVTFLTGVIESKPKSTSTSSKRFAVIFTGLILVFFYSCSAALVLYWITVNVLQIAEKSYVKKYMG